MLLDGWRLNLKTMKANTIENLIADMIFKISPADENISDYLMDCASPFNLKNQTL